MLLRQIASGQSIAVMVREAVAAIENIHPQSGSLKQTMKRLERDGFVWSKVLSMFLGGGGKAGVSLQIVGLTPLGREVCQAAGWRVWPTEYERLCQVHEAERFPDHTLCILVFAREAYRRNNGYDICTADLDDNIMPDVTLFDSRDPDDDFETLYVEVERKGDCPSKWQRISRLNDGLVYVCAPNPAKRESLVREISGMGYGGWATDLRTLLYEQASPLWLQEIWPE